MTVLLCLEEGRSLGYARVGKNARFGYDMRAMRYCEVRNLNKVEI